MSELNHHAVENERRHALCPLCRSKEFVNLGAIAYLLPIRFSAASITLSRQPELCRCRSCRSGFVQNTVDEETARMLYSASRAGDRWAAKPFEQNKTPEMVDSMAAVFGRKGRVLDIGCNTGELLDFARGFGCETAGVEFSASSREVLAQKGHHGFASMDEVTGTYDVITAFDLVEHLYDVESFLKLCVDRLAPGGKLVICTGDVVSISALVSGARWWYLKYPEHIVFPSRKYLREKSGLRLEKCVATYASKGYKYPKTAILKSIWYDIVRRGSYTGLPSIGPDHMLAILSK